MLEWYLNFNNLEYIMSNDETRVTLNMDRALSAHADTVAKDLGFGTKATLMRVALIEFLKNHGHSYKSQDNPIPGNESGGN